MSYNFPGGVPAFIAKFRNALQDLRDAQEPVSDAMAKSMLLSKVLDRDYRHIVDILLASSDTYEQCVTRLLDKYNMMNQSMNNHGYKQANQSKGRGYNRSNNDNLDDNQQYTKKGW